MMPASAEAVRSICDWYEWLLGK